MSSQRTERGTARRRPTIGISAGDPAGIGPEVTAKALAEKRVYEIARPLVVCDRRVVEDAIRFSGLSVGTRVVREPSEAACEWGTIDVLDMKNVAELEYGKVAAANGRAAFEYVRRVIELALAREIDATVTAPINKESLNLAGHHHSGHTEIYAAMSDTKDYAMMLADGDFRVVHVSTHVSLREACDRVKRDRIVTVIGLARAALKKIGIAQPRIAVAALNPHGGEAGLFGREEIEEIAPAIDEAKQTGIDVDGPIPADTVFSRMRGGQYDVVVVMYHDQGHIPMKLAGFEFDRREGTMASISGVNVTLGLPIVRTSVDHGTAFDIAGEGRANPGSMIQAIEMAAQLA